MVPLFRDLRGDRYVDTVTIRDQDKGTWNRTTKQYDGGTPSTVYTGGALIRPAGVSDLSRGMMATLSHDYEAWIPDTAGGFGTIRPNHSFTIDATLLEADLVGEVGTVQWVADDTYEVFTHLLVKLNEQAERG